MGEIDFPTPNFTTTWIYDAHISTLDLCFSKDMFVSKVTK